MQIPEYVESGFSELQNQLGKLLDAQKALPDDISKIPDPDKFPEGSKERDICLTQHYYALTTLIVSVIFPVIKALDEKAGVVKNVANAVTGIGFSMFRLKKHLGILTIAGQYSYYAASMLVSALLSIKAGFDAKNGTVDNHNDPEANDSTDTNSDKVAVIQGALKNVGLDPESILAAKISLFQQYAHSSEENAYKTCEKFCQNFNNIEATINELDQQIGNKCKNLLITSYQTNIYDSEQKRKDNLKQIAELLREFVVIETEFAKPREGLKHIEIETIAALPQQLLKVAKDSNDYQLETAPSLIRLTSVQQQCNAINHTITTTKTKLATLTKQIENELYFNQEFIVIVEKTIIPIKEKLIPLPTQYDFESMPEQSESNQDIVYAQSINQTPTYNNYSAKTYAELLADLTTLENINFAVAAKNPPHSEDNPNAKTIFVDELNTEIEPLKQLLLEQKKQQEQLLYQALTTLLEQQQSIFKTNCTETLDELNQQLQHDLSNANEAKLNAEELFYNQHEEKLKQQLQLEKLIYAWVKKRNLSEDQPAKKLIQHFLTGEIYQNFIAAFNQLAEPIERTIKQGQAKIEIASSAKIKQLEQKAKQLAENIPLYQQALAQIKNTISQQQSDYQNKENEFNQLTDDISQKLAKITTLIAELTKNGINEKGQEISKQTERTTQTIEPVTVELNPETSKEKITALESAKQSLNLMCNDAGMEIITILESLQKSKTALEAECIQNNIYLSKIRDKKNSLHDLRNSIVKAFEQEKNRSGIQKFTDRGASFNPIIQQFETSSPSKEDEEIVKYLRKQQSITNIMDEDQDEKDCLKFLDNLLNQEQKTITVTESNIKSIGNTLSNIANEIETHQRKSQQLKILNDELNTALTQTQQTAENALQQLAEQQAEVLDPMYSQLTGYLPENTQITVDNRYQIHCQNLRSMKIEPIILTVKLALIKLKQATYTQQNELKKSAENVEKITIKSAAQQNTKQLSDTKITLTQLQATFDETKKSIDTLTKELDRVLIANNQELSATEISSAQQKEILALTNLKETISAELKLLEQQNTRFIEQLRKKKNQLLFETDIFNREAEKKQKHQTILTEAENCITEIQAWENRLDQKQYDETLIDKIIHGEAINFIEAERDFYFGAGNTLEKWRTTIAQLNQHFIQPETATGLDKAFNRALCEKIDQLETMLINTSRKNNERRAEWQAFTQTHQVIQNSQQVIQNSKTRTHGNYTDHDLRGIQLRNTTLQQIENANFQHATLNSCTFIGSLAGVDFSNTDISTCCFDKALFQRVKFNGDTQFNWQEYSYRILCDNLADPYTNTDQPYMTELIQLIKDKHGYIPASWVLTILKQMNVAEKPQETNETTHWHNQQQHAIFLLRQIVPKLGFKELLELGYQLVINKHAGDNNPYSLILRELGCFRRLFPYGNNDAWNEIITLIKTRLDTLAERRITAHQTISFEQYEQLTVIMNTKASHTYGFGKLSFFFTPELATKWAGKRDELVVLQNNSLEILPK